MNSEEVISLLRQSIKHYLEPETVRASESREDASIRQLAAIRELFEELRRYLFTTSTGAAAMATSSAASSTPPPLSQSNAFHEVCLSMAQAFMDRRQFREAYNTCLQAFHLSRNTLDAYAAEEASRLERGGKMAALLQEETAAAAGARDDATKKKTSLGAVNEEQQIAQMHRHRGTLLSKQCSFFLILEADPHVEGPFTAKELEDSVDAIVSEMQAMIPHNEQFYFLLYNATLMVFQCCQELIRLGYFRLAAPYAAYCARMMDGVLPLATVKFLPWRLRLYSTVCLCYEALRETSGALKVANHAQKVTELLYELEMSDVVPPPQHVQETLQACLLDARLQAQRLRLRDAAASAVGSQQPHHVEAKGKGGKGTAAVAAAGAPPSSNVAGVPGSALELMDTVRSTIREGASAATSAPSVVTTKSLDVLCSIAVDYNSRWMSFPPTVYDNAPTTTPTDADVILGDVEPLKALAADAVLQQLSPMVEAFLRKNIPVAKMLGWGSLYEDAPRPTTAEADATPGSPSAKKGPPGKAAAKKAAPAPPSPSTSSKPSPAGGGFADGASSAATPLDEFVLQGPIPVSALCGWVRAAFVANFDVSTLASAPAQLPVDTTSSPYDASVKATLPPSTFNKLLAVVLEIIRNPSYGALFPDPTETLQRSVLLPSRLCAAAAVELSIVQAMSNIKCALHGLTATTPPPPQHRGSEGTSPAVVEQLRSRCVQLAALLVSALTERELLFSKGDLYEDAARLLLAGWRLVPISHEAEGAADVFRTAAMTLMVTAYPDVLTTGNCALTASRLLQSANRHEEALALVRPVEEYLSGRQSEYVFNHNSWLHQRGGGNGSGVNSIFGETLRRDKAATLDSSMWLRGVRDVRTHLVQHLATLRLSVSAARLHDSNILEHSRKVEVLKTREERSHLFGALSRKERRVVALMEAATLEPPVTAEAMERKLAAWAGKDAVHSALVWIEIAKRQPDAQQKRDKLKKASEYLEQAQASYDATLRALIADQQKADEPTTMGRGGGMAVVGSDAAVAAALSGGAPTRPGTAPSEFALGSARMAPPSLQQPSMPQSNLVTPRTHASAAGVGAKGTPGGQSVPPLVSPRGVGGKGVASKSSSSPSASGEQNAGGGDHYSGAIFSPEEAMPEVTTPSGLSIFLVWALFGEACSTIDALDLCRRSKIEEVLFARFVQQGNPDTALWNKNPFAVDTLNRTVCNTSSSYLAVALGKAFGVIAASHALDTPYTPDGAMIDDDEDGLDNRRTQLRQVQRNFSRCGNTAIMGLELAACADDQPSMAVLCHQVFNYTLPLLIAKSPSIIALRPLTTLFHVMMLFDERRWSDGPLQYLAARSIRATFSIARTLSGAAQRPILQAALNFFSHVWPLVLSHPNIRQSRHIDNVVSQIQYVDRVMNSKFRKPNDAANATPADAPVKGKAASAAKGPAAGAKGAGTAAAAAAASLDAGETSLYLRSDLFFDDLMPVEYLELLDEVILRIPGGVAICEQMENKYVPMSHVAAGGSGSASPPPTSNGRPQTGGGNPTATDEPQRRVISVRRDAQTLFPPLIIQTASMLASNVQPSSIVAKTLEAKSSDPFFAKVCASVALELVARRQDEHAIHLCTEGVKEILKRHDRLSSLQKESLRILRESLTALGHYASPVNATGAESAAHTATMEERLLQKMSRRISEIRRRFAFKRLRSWYVQYDIPFQALLNLILSICSQHEAERERARMALLSSQGVTPQSAQHIGASVVTPPSTTKAAAAANKGGAKGAAETNVGAALHSGMGSEDRLQQAKEDAVKYAVKAAVLFNRSYRVQYAYMTFQVYVNAMRNLFATEPPSTLTDVLHQARMADHGAISSRSAGSNNGPAQSFHLTLQQANTKPLMDAISAVETPCKVMANEMIRLLKLFQDGFVNAAKEVESLQPVSVKTGEDCLPERGGIIRRTTSLQMWLTDEGQFEERRRDLQDVERRLVRERIYQRERDELQEIEHWERLSVFKAWVREFLELSKGEGASDDTALVDSLYMEFKVTTGAAPSSRHSQTTDGADSQQSTRLGGGAQTSSPIPPALIKSNRKAAAKKKIQILQSSKQTPSPGSNGGDDAVLANNNNNDVGYQTIAFEAKLGHHISLGEVIRCFSYVVRCLQYGQRKQSAVAMSLEMNEITKNHFATLLLPYALNLQTAMGQNTEKIMLAYMAGHREVVRTKKLIQEAHRALTAYKETDAYRRAQLKLANTLQPSRRGIVVQQDAEVVSVATSATGGGGGGAGSAYKEVVSAFQNAISYLRQKHSTLLLVGVLFELGHLHLHHRVRAEAERCWNDVVDAAFSAVNALKNWRSMLEKPTPRDGEGSRQVVRDDCGEEQDILDRIGLHKGLMSAAALASLAMYSYAENQKKATEACLLAAEVLRAMIAAGNLGAPQRPWDHGRFTVQELFVNVALSETYSEFMPTIVNGFLYVAQHLLAAGYPQHSIYASNVAEHLALHALRAKDCVVYARLLKAKAAAANTDFRAAFDTLHGVAVGRHLPDLAGGALGVLVNISEASSRSDVPHNAAGGAAAKKDAKGPPSNAKGKGTTVEDASMVASGDATCHLGPPHYDNSKAPTHPENLKAVEGLLLALFPSVALALASSTVQPPPPVLTLLAPSVMGLADAVAAEYGPALSRQVIAAVAYVMLSLASCDVVASWQAAADTAAAAEAAAAAAASGGKKQAADKKDGKGAAAATQQGAPTGPSAVSVALKAAEVLSQTLSQCVAANSPGNANTTNTSQQPPAAAAAAAAAGGAKPKDAAAAAALAAAAASAPSTITSQTTPVEQSFWEHQSIWISANVAALQGNFKQAATLLTGCLATHNTKDSFTLAVPHIPSFTMSTTGRFLCDVYTLMGKCLLWMREFPRAEEAAAAGALIADHCGDTFAQREYASLKISCAMRRGDGMVALDDIERSTRQAKALSFRGADAFYANAIISGHVLHHAVVDDPRLQHLSVLLPMYDAALHAKTCEALRDVSGQLARRAEDLGLNTGVDSAVHPCVVNAQTSAVYDLHHSINHLAELQLRCNLVEDSVQSLRWALKVSSHYDVPRMPHETVVSKLRLAIALRQLHYAAGDAKLGMALVCALPRDRPLSHALMPTSDDDLVHFFENGQHPHVREVVHLLRSVIHDSIHAGTHDYEVLRSAFVNLAFVTGRFPQLSLVTVNLTALACATSAMQCAVANNTSAFASCAVTPENPTGALGIPGGDVPPAVVSVLDDMVRRDAANQTIYADSSLSLWNRFIGNNAAAAAPASTAKTAAAANTGAQPPSSVAPPPLTVSLPVVASTFVRAHNERPTVLPAQRVAIDSLLLTLRSFLQSKTVPFTLAGLPDPSPSAASPPPPWLLFNRSPKLVVSPSAASGPTSPSWFPKANFVFTQNFVSNVSTPTHQDVEGELRATLPFVTMLFTVSALSDASAVAVGSAVAANSGAASIGGPPAAAGKGSATKASVAASAPSAVEESASSGFLAMPIVLSIPCVPQQQLSALHRKAKDVLRKHTLLAEMGIQLDEVLQDAAIATGGAIGGSKGDNSKKGGGPPATKEADGGSGGLAATIGTGMTPRVAPRHTGPTDEEKSDVLLGFIELLVVAACGETAPKNRDAFYPRGAITMDHITFIAAATNVDGGWASLSQLVIHEWALRLGKEIIRCITRGETTSAAAVAA